MSACAPRAAAVRSSGRWPPTRPTGTAGPRRGSSRPCSRPARCAGDPILGARFLAEAAAPGVEPALRRRGAPAGAGHEGARRGGGGQAGMAERELKSGRGGIRDIEFAMQLLQLVHGRADPALRSPATLSALDELVAGGYVAAGRRRRPGRGLPLPAHRGAPPAAGRGPAGPRRCPPMPRRGSGWPGCWAFVTTSTTPRSPRSRAACAATRPRCARSTSGCFSGLCSRPSPPPDAPEAEPGSGARGGGRAARRLRVQ